MRWERSRPLWPKLAALGLLMVLSLAAPRTWQGATSRVTQIENLPAIEVPVPTRRWLPSEERLEAPPTRPVINLDALIAIRDLLLQGFEQLPAVKPIPEPRKKTAQVRVRSEHDRLAILPPRVRTQTRSTAPIFSPSTPDEEAANFAAILLEAARRPKPQPIPTQPRVAPGLRLAMRPTIAPPIEPEPHTLPTEPNTLPTEPNTLPTESEASGPALSADVAELPLLETPVDNTPSPEPRQVEIPIVKQPLLRQHPQALEKQLESFEAGSFGVLWSQQVLAKIRLLTDENNSTRPDVADTLTELEQLFITGIEKSEDPANLSYHNQWQQAAQALGRRLVLWRILLDPAQPTVIEGGAGATNFMPVLNDVAELLEEHSNGVQWREYLQLEKIAAALSESFESPTLARAKLAQEVLARMSDRQLTEVQLEFLTKEPFQQLHRALRPWAAGTVNLETLVAIVERYELGRESRYAEVIAQLQQRLKWSEDPQLQLLAVHLDEHYRSANMRLAMSDVLLNRMLPKQKPIITPVRERIAGAKVRGRARTTTQLRVRMLPAPNAWRFVLEAFGKVYSDTKSDTWPARIRNAAKMQYQARKEISINEHGVQSNPTQATAKGRNELVGVDSDLDPMPIVGFLLRDMAAKKHRKNRPAANTQAKAKVVRSAKKRMDSTLNEKLESLEKKFRDRVLAQIEQLALLAEPLDIYTTNERAVMQLRFANSGQLAAHTLRPLAPSDSVLSIQMHESALNNAMMGLGLDGRRMTMLELFQNLTTRFGRPNAKPPEDLSRATIIQFARRDALRVQCEGDRLELVLSVVELAHRRDKIKNFQIHVHFRPELDGLRVKLVRDGSLQFSGRRLKTGPRVVLHSVIGKLIDQNQEIPVLNDRVQQDPRLAGLMVTQLVLEDGWIGLALGPAHRNRTANRARKPEVLATPFVR